VKFPINLDRVVTLSCGSEVKYQTNNTMAIVMEPSHVKIVLLNRLIFWYSETMISPPKVAKKVAKSIGKKTSDGLVAPAAPRKAITETGMSVRPEVLRTKNIIWLLEAVFFVSFNSCS